jgi:adenosylcobyric acid synthase
MILGTASDVGKSLIATGLCRLFARAGRRVAPFKAWNMSNNAYVCLDGGEIGWAQALQARACGLVPSVDMNPLLLKPTTDQSSQLIVRGRVAGIASAQNAGQDSLREQVRASFQQLSQAYELIILEGAGGAAEINLRDRDIANFAMAEMADAPVLLVADIDRGGVFASLVGTLELLEPAERERVVGLIINKFRGDVSLLEPGLRVVEERTGKPVLGVVPYLSDVGLEAEDSVSIETYRKYQPGFTAETVNIAVIAPPYIANFTDFLPLAQLEAVRLNYVLSPDEVTDADAIILPGSKNSIADLRWLKAHGWPPKLHQARADGKYILGICAGYQMLGAEIADPLGVEGEPTVERGLGLLPVQTVLAAHKTARQVEVEWQVGEQAGVFSGYEIHMGQTSGSTRQTPLFGVRGLGAKEWRADGSISPDQRVCGAYVHGLFESGEFVQAWLTQCGARRGIRVRVAWQSWHTERNNRLDRLADVLAEHLDMATIASAVE